MRAVFDCMIYLQAAANPAGAAMACFLRLEESGGTLCVSHGTLTEIAEVLTRPELHRKFKRLTPLIVAEFLDDVRMKAMLIDPVPAVIRLTRDPDDEPYVNLAVAGDADFLVTWNARHLTYLMGADTPEEIVFKKRYPKLRIVDPVTFLRTIGQ